MKISNCFCLVAVTFALSMKPFAQSQAGPVVFAVDQTQSQITLSGAIVTFSGLFSAPLSTQGPGSLVTAYSGNINAVVAGSAIQFTGSSTICAQTNGLWQPAPGGASGSGLANYAGQAQAWIPFVGTNTAFAALRQVVLDVTSPLLTATTLEMLGLTH